MPYMYGILAVVGWVWTAAFGTYLIVRLIRQPRSPRGFEVKVEPRSHSEH